MPQQTMQAQSSGLDLFLATAVLLDQLVSELSSDSPMTSTECRTHSSVTDLPARIYEAFSFGLPLLFNNLVGDLASYIVLFCSDWD
jgi:hypothetical protein